MIGKASLVLIKRLNVKEAMEAIERGFGYYGKHHKMHVGVECYEVQMGGVTFKMQDMHIKETGEFFTAINASIPKKDGWTVPAALSAIARVIGGSVSYEFDAGGLQSNLYVGTGGSVNQIKRYQS